MTRRRPHTILAGAAVIPLVALAIAGCGDDDDSGNQATAATPKTNSGHTATIGVATSGGLGKILTDSQGNTVYLFQKDTGTTSTCSGDCAVAAKLTVRFRHRGKFRYICTEPGHAAAGMRGVFTVR